MTEKEESKNEESLQSSEEETNVTVEKIDKAFERRKDRVDETTGKASDLVIDDTEKKMAELKTIEGRIDRKNRELKSLIAEAEQHGKSLAGDAVKLTEDQQKTKECNEFLNGTGLSIPEEVD